MSIGEPIWAFYGFIKAERPRIIAEVAQREGPNTELFDLADDLVVRGPSGEVERFVDALHKAIMMRMGEINAMHERDLLRHRIWKAGWEVRWLVKIVFDKRDMETVEVFVRDLARKNALEYDGASEDDAFTEEEIRALMEERLGSKRQWNAWKRTQQEEAGEAGESEEPISKGPRFLITTAISASRFIDSPRDAKVAERVPEAPPPPVAAPDATDSSTDSSTECPPPAETCSTRGFEDDISFWFGDDVSGWGSTASARPSRIPPPGFPLPGRADVKTSNRARARNRVDERVRQPNQAMRPLSVRVMRLSSSSEKREREDATTARSPEGDERAVGYEPVADGADGDVAVAEDRRDRAPAAEATRREDVGDAAEPSRDGDAERKAKRQAQLDAELEREVKRGCVRVPATGPPPAPSAVGESADEAFEEEMSVGDTNCPPGRRATRPLPRDRARRVEAKAGGESRGESQAGGLYGFAKKAHVFLVERAARASAALAALFLSRAFFSPAGKRVDREDGKNKPKPSEKILPEDFAFDAKAVEVMRRKTS